MSKQRLLDRISRREAVVGIVGMGYVGLPLALTFAKSGFSVLGFDIDENKLQSLRAGQSYIKHIPTERVAEAVARQKLHATSDFTRVRECDAVLLCVPTPIDKNREPDMSYVEGTARAIAPHLVRGQLVALESTTYPGTSQELLKPILEQASQLAAGADFYLAFSPEREDPGNRNFDTQRIPKVVGGLTPDCRDVAVALYQAALDEVVPVSTLEAAELTKLLENIFRSVNIALVNELKLLCDRMGIDIWEVIDAASTKPFGYMPFYPGPGLGGHCIPIDPFYLTWKAREYEFNTRFIELAGEINVSMPRFVVSKTAEALNERKKAVRGAKIVVLGLAYKRDVDDARESPSFRIMQLLAQRGAELAYHDPFIPDSPELAHHGLALASVELTDALLTGADAVVIVTDHTTVDYERVVRLAPLVIDTRNATRNVKVGREKIVRA